MEMVEKKITIISTFAKDKIIDEATGVIKQQEGGPAFYLKKVFEKEKIPFDLKIFPKIMEVEILATHDEEFGRIPNSPIPLNIAYSSIQTPFLLISTVLVEFSLEGIAQFNGKVFLDIQGYVRDERIFGKKKQWTPNNEIMDSIFCLKGTKNELRNISQDFLEVQKNKVLIITKGDLGCEIFASGDHYSFRPKKIIKKGHTIGAGDTFFAYLISQFILGNNVLCSAEYAMDQTINFLSSR